MDDKAMNGVVLEKTIHGKRMTFALNSARYFCCLIATEVRNLICVIVKHKSIEEMP